MPENITVAMETNMLTGTRFLREQTSQFFFLDAEFSIALGNAPKLLAFWLLQMSSKSYVKLHSA